MILEMVITIQNEIRSSQEMVIIHNIVLYCFVQNEIRSSQVFFPMAHLKREVKFHRGFRLVSRDDDHFEMLDGEDRLFSDEPLEKKPVMTIEDFVWYSDDYFESHLLGNRLYVPRGGGLGSSTIFKKFNEPYAPS